MHCWHWRHSLNAKIRSAFLNTARVPRHRTSQMQQQSESHTLAHAHDSQTWTHTKRGHSGCTASAAGSRWPMNTGVCRGWCRNRALICRPPVVGGRWENGRATTWASPGGRGAKKYTNKTQQHRTAHKQTRQAQLLHYATARASTPAGMVLVPPRLDLADLPLPRVKGKVGVENHGAAPTETRFDRRNNEMMK